MQLFSKFLITPKQHSTVTLDSILLPFQNKYSSTTFIITPWATKGAILVFGGVPPQLGTAPPQVGTAPPQVGTAPPQLGTAPPQVGTAPPQLGTVPPQVGIVPTNIFSLYSSFLNLK